MFHPLRTIFYLSIPIFIVHGIEEYLTGFASIDPIFAFVFRPVISMATNQGLFIVFQGMVWLLLIVSALLLLDERWQQRLILIPGILYILEIHHLIEVVIRRSYYPGSFTAIAFPILAYYFWKEYMRSFHS